MNHNNMTRDKPPTREGVEGLVGDSNDDENQSVTVLSCRSIIMQVCNWVTDHWKASTRFYVLHKGRLLCQITPSVIHIIAASLVTSQYDCVLHPPWTVLRWCSPRFRVVVVFPPVWLWWYSPHIMVVLVCPAHYVGGIPPLILVAVFTPLCSCWYSPTHQSCGVIPRPLSPPPRIFPNTIHHNNITQAPGW